MSLTVSNREANNLLANTLSTYIVRVHVSVGKSHGQVVFVHDLSTDPADNRRVEVVAQRKVRRQETQSVGVADWAVDIPVLRQIAHGRFERRKSSLQGHIEQRFRSEELEREIIGSELGNDVSPSRLVIETLYGKGWSLIH